MSNAPSLKDALRAHIGRALEGVHVSMPGTVVSYDQATQTATIRPAVQQQYQDGRGKLVTAPYPDIPAVPVLFPTSAGAALTFPLTAGDPVILLVGESSTDEWRDKGQESNAQADTRRFDLSDSVAIPGGRPRGADDYATGATVLRSTDIRLGGSSASDYVALASLVLDRLDTLRAEIIAHTHDTGVGPTGPALGVGPTSDSVAATTTKAL